MRAPVPFAPAMRNIRPANSARPPGPITPPTPFVKFDLDLLQLELSIYYLACLVEEKRSKNAGGGLDRSLTNQTEDIHSRRVIRAHLCGHGNDGEDARREIIQSSDPNL
jgi:hypothetical protein